MDAATGEDSEAGLERAEVVLLEADLAASTALDMMDVCGAEMEGSDECFGKEEKEGEEN